MRCWRGGAPRRPVRRSELAPNASNGHPPLFNDERPDTCGETPLVTRGVAHDGHAERRTTNPWRAGAKTAQMPPRKKGPERICKPDSVTAGCPAAAAIPLDRRLPAGSSDIPEVERGPRDLVLVLLRVGFAARRRYRHRGSLPIVSPTPRAETRGRLLSVALSPDRSEPPLAATRPAGVRTFLPPRSATRDCPILSGRPQRRRRRRRAQPTRQGFVVRRCSFVVARQSLNDEPAARRRRERPTTNAARAVRRAYSAAGGFQ